MTSDPSLWYCLAHFDGVSAARPGAFLLLLLVPALGWWHRKDGIAAACRLAAFAVVVAALAGTRLHGRVPDERLALVAAVDVSDSIGARGREWAAKFVDEVAASLAPGDEFGVVTFAAGAAVVRPPGPPGPVAPSVYAIGAPTSATDISAGLRAGMALLPGDVERRVLLITDGNETRGDSRAQIAEARRSGTALFVAVPPAGEAPDVALDKLAVAPFVSEGAVFPVRIVARNRSGALPGSVRLWLDGALVGEERLTLQPGRNAVEIPYRIAAAGNHRLRAEVAVAGDDAVADNSREIGITVGGKARALLVTTQPAPVLAAVLQRKDVAVTAAAPERLPTEFDDLLAYHCVILDDVGAAAFRPGSLDALERYVRDGGGGLVVASGEVTFGDTRFRNTALERLLPVTIEPRRPPRPQRVPLALVLVIDRSNSMGYHVRSRSERSADESKLAYAKRAALAVVKQLSDNDLVGIIAFDSEPFELAPLRPLRENRMRFLQDVPRLQPGGGTDFHDALESAGRQLEASRLATAHVILLTDGDTNRAAGEHGPLIERLARAGISVTAIRIGDDTVNLELLHRISARTGGAFYHVEDASSLPQLLVKDAGRAMDHTPAEPPKFVPRESAPSPMLRGLEVRSLPPLSSYAASRPRDGADVVLHVQASDRKDPLLSAWQVGLGRVVAFTASPDADAAAWAGWESFGKFWSQIVRWAGREQTPRDYALAVERVGGRLTLRVDTFADLDARPPTARFFAGKDGSVDVALHPRARRRLAAQLPDVPPGRYAVTILGGDGDAAARARTSLVDVPASEAEPHEEYAATGPNRGLLRSLAEETGGGMDVSAQALGVRRPGNRRLERSLDWLLVPAAMALVLADVSRRRR